MDYNDFKNLCKNEKWAKRKRLRSIKGGNIRKYTRRTKSEDTEGAVQREVLQRAFELRVLLFRQQAGAISTGNYHIKLAPPGAADLTGITPDGSGRRLEVECKRRYGGVQSDDQKLWQKRIENLGGVYLLVRSGNEFEEKIKEYLDEQNLPMLDVPES
jgi:hypothetical protein